MYIVSQERQTKAACTNNSKGFQTVGYELPPCIIDLLIDLKTCDYTAALKSLHQKLQQKL